MPGKEFNHLPKGKRSVDCMDYEKLSAQCYMCSSKLSVAQLLEKKGHFRVREGFLQLLDCSRDILPKILPAYFNAIVREEEGIMQSNEAANEMIMLLSGEMNVGKAIGACGIKSAESFILFVAGKVSQARLKSELRLLEMKKLKLGFEKEDASQIAAGPLLNG